MQIVYLFKLKNAQKIVLKKNFCVKLYYLHAFILEYYREFQKVVNTLLH